MIKYLENISLEYGSFFMSDRKYLFTDIPHAIYNSGRYFYIISPYSSGEINDYKWHIRSTYDDFSVLAKVRKVHLSFYSDDTTMIYEEFDIKVNGKDIHCRYDYDLTFDEDRTLPNLVGKTIKTHEGIRTITLPSQEFSSVKEYIDSPYKTGENVLIGYIAKEDGKFFDISTSRLINRIKRYERRMK